MCEAVWVLGHLWVRGPMFEHVCECVRGCRKVCKCICKGDEVERSVLLCFFVCELMLVRENIVRVCGEDSASASVCVCVCVE